MPSGLRTGFEAQLGVDLGHVRVHTDEAAGRAASTINARAFTLGNQIAFAVGEYAPETPDGRRLLAHELAHVVQQEAVTAPRVQRRGLLSAQQVASAIRFNRSRFDTVSVMVIQGAVGAPVTGTVDARTVELIATFQQAYKLPWKDGMVQEATVDRMVRYLATQRDHDEAIHLVVDFYRMPVEHALSIRYDPKIVGTALDFEAGYLAVIRVGPHEFQSARRLRNAIGNELSVPPPGGWIMAAIPQTLNPVQVTAALQANRRRLKDRRAILAIQFVVQVPPSGVMDASTVQGIADYQRGRRPTAPDGVIDDQATLPAVVADLLAQRQRNAVIRLLMNYYQMPEHDALLSISAARRGGATGWLPGPAVVHIGAVAFRGSYARLVHYTAGQLELLRTLKVGVKNPAARSFLSMSVRVVSRGLPEEPDADFIRDANRTLRYWNRIRSTSLQARYWNRFIAVERKLHQRYQAAPSAHKAWFTATLRAFSRAARPRGVSPTTAAP